MMAFRNRCEDPIEVLSNSNLENIHEDTLKVMQETGVVFRDPQALEFLQSHGCDVDTGKEIVYFPPDLVERSLGNCPQEFRLRARNPAYDILFDETSVHFAACSGMTVLDLETMQRRPGTIDDAVEAARLCDALENIAGSNTGLGEVSDKPTETNLEWLYATAIRNSEKVTSVAVMNDSEQWGIRMAKAAGEDIIVTVNSASPLGWTEDQIRGARRALEADLPLGLQSMASPGLTAPATLAGTATVMNAEILSMAVYVQLLKPGTGLMYSCFTIPLDMQTTMLATGSIELGLLTAASAQLSRRYDMGSIVYLPMSDAKLPDQQAGYEKAMQWLLAAMSGVNLIWGAGMLDGHSLWSNAQLVIDAEMCGMVSRSLDGFRIDREARAVDLIQKIGHFPASYLGTDHTLEYWESERYLPLISLRESYDDWMRGGAKDLLQRADERALTLLAEHEVVPLPKDVDKQIKELIIAAGRDKGLG
ncbi:MAG: trimethylamine methyltransferase family protein [Anaerolineales bacterium]|jgi:trimethylamine--corrinoid protein Co-methyltransferase